MLIKDFEKVEAIDREINSLQASLGKLYRQRSSLFSGHMLNKKVSKLPTSELNKYWYSNFQNQWKRRDVTIPSRQKLAAKITKGIKLAESLAGSLSLPTEMFSLLLVPPTNLYNYSQFLTDITDLADRYAYQDHTEFTERKSRTWRVLVVYAGAEGLDWGSAESILDQNKHHIRGVDLRDLGVYEYMLFSSMQVQPIDQDNWVWLLKNAPAETISASYINGTYHFMVDDVKGWGQGERFRPAVEV